MILSLISSYGLVYQISLIDIIFLYLFLIKYHYNLLTYTMLIDKSIYLFEKSVSFFHIIGSINVYYSVNALFISTFISNSLPSLSLYSSINLNSTFFFIQIATPLELLVPLLWYRLPLKSCINLFSYFVKSEFLALKGYYIVVVLTILLIFVFFQIVEVHLY